jgi:hypothetical protein
MNVKEAYTPYPLAANATLQVAGPQMGGFLCITGGALTVADSEGNVKVNALPVTAGVHYPIPIRFGGAGGGVVTLGGGASGTVMV